MAAGTTTPGAHPVRLLAAGEQGLVVELGDGIDPAVNARVRWLARAIARDLGDAVLEVVPTYRSLLVIHDPLRTPRALLAGRISALALAIPADAEAEEPAARIVSIPVCYGGALGPDLEFVAAHAGLTPEAAVAAHAAPTYLVYMLGFTPGFPYLGGMSRRIAAPRLDAPRPRVAAGSVGIGGEQTGIYPVESPGGWRIIGRTPLRLFDPRAPSPFLLRPGDRIRFTPVDGSAFTAIAAGVASGSFVPEVSAVAGGPP